MQRSPFTHYATGPVVHEGSRGIPRRKPTEGERHAMFGAHKDANAKCLDELGVGRIELSTLVYLVARRDAGVPLTSRSTIDEFLRREEGFTVSNALRTLQRRGFVGNPLPAGGVSMWQATELGVRKVRMWCGEFERSAAE